MRRMRLRHWAFVGLAVAVAAACVALGLWQLSRLSQRRAANELIRAQAALPPLQLAGGELPTGILAYRSAQITGMYDSARQIVLLNRTYNDEPGSHLVTPLLLTPDGPAILIDRGWIPFEQSSPEDIKRFDQPGVVQVKGSLRSSQAEPGWSILADPPSNGTWRGSWRYLNIDRLQEQFPYDVLPVYLAQSEPSSNALLPRADAALDLSEGPHLSYAIQWFSFAAIALIGGGIWLRRQLMGNDGGSPG